MISPFHSIFHTRRLRKHAGTNCRSMLFFFLAAITPRASYPGKRSTPGRSRPSFGNNLNRDLFRQWEYWLDIDRHILQPVERLLHWRPDHRVLVQNRFGFVVRSLSFEREQVVCKLRHAGFDLRVIDAERAFTLVELNRSLVSEIVELHRHATPVCFGNPETN